MSDHPFKFSIPGGTLCAVCGVDHRPAAGTVPSAGIPPARIRAYIKLMGPSEMTPDAKRMLERICQEYE